jgi:hypothetical protein
MTCCTRTRETIYRCYRYGGWGGFSGRSTNPASTNYNDAGYIHTKKLRQEHFIDK